MMREQIDVYIPQRLGRIINEGITKHVIVKGNHRDIHIHVLDDEEFLKQYTKDDIQLEISVEE